MADGHCGRSSTLAVTVASPSTAALAERHVRIRESLDALSLDALIVTPPSNIRYLSNHAGTAGILVITRDAVHLLVDFRYDEAVRALQATPSACPGLQLWDVPASYEEALIECLADIGVTTVGFEAAHVTVARYEWWRETIAGRGLEVTLRSTERIVEQARLIKDVFEVATLREAAARLDTVIPAVLAAVRAGESERQIAAVIETAIRDAGYERLAFDTIVASGPHSAMPHYRAGTRVLATGDLVVLDFGGVLDGYCCDLTRTVSIGPPSREARRVYDAVRDAHAAAVAAVKPGIDASAVDAAARDLLCDRGLGDAFGHGTGHGLGLDIHEEPRVGKPRADVPPVTLAPNMVFTIEPGAYLPGFGGVRIEDDVLVTPHGCELLTQIPREELLAL
jgi:Xaa-Pro aminopeptidase